MEVKLGTRFFNKHGQVYRVKHYTAHFILFESWYPPTKEWIIVTNPVRTEQLQRDIRDKEIYLDTPANRVLYGKDISIET